MQHQVMGLLLLSVLLWGEGEVEGEELESGGVWGSMEGENQEGERRT